MQRIFETFLDRLHHSVDEADLRDTMEWTAEMLGLPTFAYLALPSKSETVPKLISNYPIGWTSRYLNEGYERIDPVMERTSCNENPFHWGTQFGPPQLSRKQCQLFDEAAEFGIRQGLTIPVHDRRGNIAAITFASDENVAFGKMACRYEQGLQLIATCFHVELRRRIKRGRVVDGIRLTSREFECLQWAAHGKSARDTGEILGISRRTVVFHMENTRRKLGVRTVAQAVARFAQSGRLDN